MDSAKSMAKASEFQSAKVIVERYLSLHAEGSYTYRPFMKKGIYRGKDYRYHADLKALLPQAALGTFSYIWGTYEAADQMSLRFALIPYGPVRIYVNNTLAARSDIFSERYRSKQIFDLPLHKGLNDLLLVCENTSGGFGCEFGTWVGKLDYYFLMPSRNPCMEGLWYSEPQEVPLEKITSDTLNQLSWLPHLPDFASEHLDLQEVFPQASHDDWAVVATSFSVDKDTWCNLECDAELSLDGQLVGSSVEVSSGEHTLVLYARIGKGVSMSITQAQKGTPISIHHPVLGSEASYRYAICGPFAVRPQGFAMQFTKPFSTMTGLDFWHLEGGDTYLRMYNDNPLFGHWNYPLGVTLYGLVETERMFKDFDPELSVQIHAYLKRHIQASIDTYDYAMWDKDTLGGATAVHHLMTSLDSLDDCGSFGSTVLEIAKDHELSSYEKLIAVVGDHICRTQPRLADGTFFRTGLMHEFHENTLWVDDLYMSVPFLCRYARYAANAEHLDDAARQFFGFAKYLYMSEQQLMSHVYDFDRNIATGIPWGRGNGWALFSLSELLMVLPVTHPKRTQLIALFRNLSAGYLRLQDDKGMFHQVLNMKESYQESSCTAMFACAFSRGVRHGWYEDPQPYRDGCIKACEGLKEMAIDTDGHVWGVCRGSEFSCSKHYYAQELLPRLDDTHGIGIILLALCDRMKLD
ncbi:glycoside hydrolase family 88/105 protein [Sphaerochaeta globosa]|uniref:Glycosyl hydrolase family 88 n=1 Tax=Sphaerochaeta globosa (strain ATCC BAA-1886 / DSM 22777 / Buddy) TaxID=158189 RepID=F0RV03_SPHGB|nr:glycoside hydrolase family 88 protein [Sphaerochaeta globosa]ADY12654.1 glycosyl hydrolase family 88 [Sphaerochaeta globosa str. Buddy]